MVVEFSKERWYAMCDLHRKRLEAMKFKSSFEPIEDELRCEWKRDLMMGDKRVHSCREQARWEFYYRG